MFKNAQTIHLEGIVVFNSFLALGNAQFNFGNVSNATGLLAICGLPGSLDGLRACQTYAAAFVALSTSINAVENSRRPLYEAGNP